MVPLKMSVAVMWGTFMLLDMAAAAVIKVQLGAAVPSVPAGGFLGRVRVYFAADMRNGPPVTQCSDDHDTAQAFGVDVENYKVGDIVEIDASMTGYPRHSLDDIPAGNYWMQAELFRYSVYHRGDGVNLTLPLSCVSDGGGDGQYGLPPGTLLSTPQQFTFEPHSETPIELKLEKVVPEVESPGCSGHGQDTEYIKSVSVSSKLLSDFWGRPMRLEACVLLPWGFTEHPDAKYPLVIAHGHYSAQFEPGGRFDNKPATHDLKGYDYVDQLYANYFYSNWTSADGPFKGARALVMTVKHPVPFFDDSYAVDSANVGPYGSAIMKELVPHVEAQFRGIGEGWARGVFGGSTGGWEALAVQVLYPDEFNYAAVACPDPVGFKSYTTINIYEDRNAYLYDAPFKQTPRPGQRDSYSGTAVLPGTSTVTYGHPYGQTTATVEEMNRREIVLGKHSRSCGQWDIWEAVFSPKGENGFPARLYCKDPKDNCNYGEINKTIASYWREHFDLLDIMQRRWHTGLGEKLSGKLHIFVGGSDTYFLTNAVMDLEDWATNVSNPPFGGTVTIGAHKGRGYEHCFNGFLPDGEVAPNGITRELYVTKFVPRMAQRFVKSAPQGANMIWNKY